MTIRSAAWPAWPDMPDATVVHAAFAPADAMLAERRALYQLATDLFAPGQDPLTVERLDSPLFRFRVGEALAGRIPFGFKADDDLEAVVSELCSGSARLRVATGTAAGDVLAEALRVIQSQSMTGGRPLEPLTEADGERFQQAIALVQEGLERAREVSPALADDLLAHTSLLVILDPRTSNGLVSASSRLFPGLILIDQPSCAFEVAEALVHEGAHQKFFDLAITRSFLGADPEVDLRFQPSWSAARWPVEQVIAAFHAYTCMAQFAEDADRALLGPNSLLPAARERAREIGQWLLGHESSLQADAQWLLHTLLGKEAPAVQAAVTGKPMAGGRYRLDPLLRVNRMASTGRVLVGRPGTPPELHWLAGDAAELVDRFAHAPDGLSLGGDLTDSEALSLLVESSLVFRAPETCANQKGVRSFSDSTQDH